MNRLQLSRSLVAMGCLAASTFSLPAQEVGSTAHSIIVNATTEMICDSPTSAVRKESRVITILNNKGNSAAHFLCMCDKFSSLSKFSGEVLAGTGGQSIRKIKKSELQMTEYSSGLASDDYMYYFECSAPSYPFTVKYEWEVKYKDGLIVYQTFIPQNEYNQAVMKASYKLQTPAGDVCRYRAVNTQAVVKQAKLADGKTLSEVSVENLPAVEPEVYGPAPSETLPIIYFAPSSFTYDGSKGTMNDWKAFGVWQYDLLKGRDQLPDALRNKVHELTADCNTPREKVQAIYNYLGATTRYVSIQLGIGGFQPIAAADVCRVGFGDCKGLSNYARAMLAELGIDSRYTVISTNNERLLTDFASVNQMNHAILQVPLSQDTLWLECTNPQLPFGYVHSSIAGHDALLAAPDGGTIYRLPTYPDSLNTQVNRARVILAPAGETKIENREISCLFQYETESVITRLEPAKQKDRLRSGISLPQAEINNIQVNEQKTARPQIDISYTISSLQYSNKTGNRLFVPVNVFRKSFTVPENKQRTLPIRITYGYLDTDSIQLQLPEGYAIESLPKTLTIEGKFGKFHSSVRVEGNQVYITHQLLMRRGTYPKEDYAAFADFRKQVAGQYNIKMILRKE